MEILLYFPGGALAIWIVSRLIFAAYFKSKQHYEDQRYGKKTQQRSG